MSDSSIPSKILFKNEDKVKMFSKKKAKEFVIKRLILLYIVKLTGKLSQMEAQSFKEEIKSTRYGKFNDQI